MFVCAVTVSAAGCCNDDEDSTVVCICLPSLYPHRDVLIELGERDIRFWNQAWKSSNFSCVIFARHRNPLVLIRALVEITDGIPLVMKRRRAFDKGKKDFSLRMSCLSWSEWNT